VFYPGPTGSTGAYGIASGLGELWLGSPTLNEIFPFSTSGVAGTGFPIPDESAKPEGIALGPDKRIWFTEWDAAGQMRRHGNAGVCHDTRVHGGIVDVWLGHPLAQVVEHHDAGLCEGSDYAQEVLGKRQKGCCSAWFLRIIRLNSEGV
jgi:hypothetical protein